jgi:hypothetical protein
LGFNPDEGEEFVQADVARELERENNIFRGQLGPAFTEIDELLERVSALERENAELRADKERLDWLESVAKDLICTGDGLGVTIGVASNFQDYATNAATFRSAIDAARKEQP